MALEEIAARGGGVIYALPEAGWVPFFRRLPFGKFLIEQYPCVSCEVPSNTSTFADSLDGTEVELLAEVGAEVEALWQQAKVNYPIRCGVVRNQAWLRWKHGGNLILGMRQHPERSLTGYAAIRKDGLVFDLLTTEPKQLRRLLHGVIEFLSRQHWGGNSLHVTQVKVMRTPLLAPVLDQLGFAENGFQFVFVCTTVGSSVTLEQLAPERWHLMPGD